MSIESLHKIEMRSIPENLKPNIFELKGKKLKVCPYCKNDQFIKIHVGKFCSYLECLQCGLRGARGLNRLDAIKRWQLMN